jgi:hypothetical protein
VAGAPSEGNPLMVVGVILDNSEKIPVYKFIDLTTNTVIHEDSPRDPKRVFSGFAIIDQ